MIVSKIRTFAYRKYTKVYPWFLRKFYGMTIGEDTIISRRANLDRNINPKGIHIGSHTLITGTTILTHDACRSLKADTYIGDYCFIAGGGNSSWGSYWKSCDSWSRKYRYKGCAR